MNPNPPTETHKLYACQKPAGDRAETIRDEEWQLHNECIALAREALQLYKAQGEKRLRIADITRLLDLASRLGRLATSTPAEHISHTCQPNENCPWWTQFEADLERIYGKKCSADFQSAVSPASSLQPGSSSMHQAIHQQNPPQAVLSRVIRKMRLKCNRILSQTAVFLRNSTNRRRMVAFSLSPATGLNR